METLFSAWRSYLTTLIPADAPPIQREECRRAFYAGAVCMFSLTLKATEPKDETVCEDNLSALHKELEAFTIDLRIK